MWRLDNILKNVVKIPEGVDFTDIIEKVQADLHGTESIRLVACVEVDSGRGKNYTVLTNQRLIFMRKGKFRMLGEEEMFRDYPFNVIEEMDVESRKNYDLLKIYTPNKDDKFMIPEDSGTKITSMLRNLESERRKEENKGETATEKLERLSVLHDAGKIDDEEFKEKKDRLMEEI